jgi:hypothetical protein
LHHAPLILEKDHPSDWLATPKISIIDKITYVSGQSSPAKKDDSTVSLSGLVSARSAITKAHVLMPIKNHIIDSIIKPIVIMFIPFRLSVPQIKKDSQYWLPLIIR